MNQDQVKEKLLRLEDPVEYFSVIFSGKTSKKVDGLYKPETREIIIHNKNMQTDNQIIYTAIHEYAHHLQFMRSPTPISGRSHTNFFWNIFHQLLVKAEELGSYENTFKNDPQFVALTQKIKSQYMAVNGSLMQEFGVLLLKAFNLCKAKHADFEDYVDRELGLHRMVAKTLIKVSSLGITPQIGYENMKIVAAIGNEGERRQAEDAFIQGESPDMIKARFASDNSRNREKDQKTVLLEERGRIERSITRLKERLAEIESRIQGLD